MILFDHLPLNADIINALKELKIDYVFQPIFYPDGKKIFAYEALMRPEEMSVTELIEEYTKLGKLHVLEVATFFGATQAYELRGYEEYVCINSFPCENFHEEETKVYDEYFGDLDGKGIVEILEYPKVSLKSWNTKRETINYKSWQVALDDFGAGNNNIAAVNLFQPHIVKLDRMLISGIDQNEEKQKNFIESLEEFHSRNIRVIAEGVETKEEYDYLVSHGADFIQGYYLARPA